MSFDDAFDRDRHTPLHLSAAWGLEKTVQCLMEHNADVNAKVILYLLLLVLAASMGTGAWSSLILE